MQTQEISVHIQPDGTVRYELGGVTAEQWEELTKVLDQSVGGQVLDRKHSCEFDPPGQQHSLGPNLNLGH